MYALLCFRTICCLVIVKTGLSKDNFLISFLVSSLPKGKKDDNDEQSKEKIGGGNI